MSEDGNLQSEVESVHSSFSSRGGATTPEARSTSTGANSKIDTARLLSQNNDLKKLLAEEQRKAKQSDDERRKKDQELRRVELEMDGFRFRNEQLLKRIEVLQSEMMPQSGKQPLLKTANKSTAHNQVSDNVVEEELMKRIQENSDLRNRLENLEALTKEQADLTAKRMSSLENDLLAAEHKQQKATAGVKQERDLLSLRSSNLEKQLKQTSADKDSTISMLEAKVSSLESQVQQHKEGRSNSTTCPLLTDTLCPPEYSRLNLNSCDSEQAAAISTRQRSRSIANISSNTDALVLSLGAYGTAILTLVQRSGVTTTTLTNAVTQARTLLQKLPSPSSGSASNSSLLSQTAGTIESLAAVIRQFIQASDSTLQASSHGVCETMDRLLSITREGAALLLTDDTPSSASTLLRLAQLSSSASGLVHDHYAALVVAFVGRTELKHALDSALQALANISSNLDAMSALLDTRARSADVTASPLISAVGSLRQQFTQRTAALRASCHIVGKPPSIQYARAIELDTALAKAESERGALAERAERLSKRLKTAEGERWMVEAQLRQVRYEKLLQRVTGAASPAPVTPSPSFGNLSSLRSREGSMADFQATESGNASEQSNAVDMTWLSKHFEDRISLVSSDAQRGDSEAASWKAESRALVARLIQARQLSVRVSSLEKTLAERDDELETVRRSYEGQLAAMAEHLATMNERIIRQADEAEVLQRQLRIQQQQSASSSSSSGKHSRKLLSKPS